MRVIQWRSAAWAALALGLVAGPVFAVPPAHTAKGTSVTVGRSGTGTTGGAGHVGGITGSATQTGTATGQTNPKARAETAMSLLHDAHRLVSGAHFPYDGHRTKALKEIDRAIRELTPPKPNPTSNPQTQTHTQAQTHTQTHHATTGQGAAKPVVQQTRAEADTKLREAIGLLTRARGRITTTNSGASEDVGAAITELNAALQTR